MPNCTRTIQRSESPPVHPSSKKKIAANRNNARGSTGPRTQRGKGFSRMNALKHGLSSKLLFVNPCRNEIEKKRFQELYAALIKEWTPTGVTEESLVAKVAMCLLRNEWVQ